MDQLRLGEVDISIHAPREGGDSTGYVCLQHSKISIHAPREGGDGIIHPDTAYDLIFQSTPPARGATPPASTSRVMVSISIHAPREGGDVVAVEGSTVYTVISIHAPREGGDSKDAQFYPRIFDK